MSKFIKRFFLVLTPVLLFVIFVNYFGDAANLYSKGYEEKIAHEILKGNNVTNISNYDERLLQKFLIRDSFLCPEILVIGSSRVMLISSDNFKEKTFFNNGVSGASVEDLIALFQMYEQKECFPKKIILGLDPWTLNINNDQTRWLTISHEYYLLSSQLTNDNKIVKENYLDSKYLQLLSPSYFQSSIREIFLSLPEPTTTSIKINTNFTKLVDGSINYELQYRSASVVEVEDRALNYFNDGIYGIEKFDTLSSDAMSLLESFVKHLRNKNAEVTIFLAPYHPKVYSFIAKSEKYRQVIESEKYFIVLGKKYGSKIIGSFNPNVLNMDGSYFYDGMHSNEKGIEIILASDKE